MKSVTVIYDQVTSEILRVLIDASETKLIPRERAKVVSPAFYKQMKSHEDLEKSLSLGR